MKKIIVLISTYNGEKYIKEQIDSILKQTIANNLEILIRDDGSTDGTLDILESICKENLNVSIIKGENVGLVKSYFILLKYVADKYEYYSLCDQDDYWLPDKLETAINKLEKNKTDKPLLYACSSFIVDSYLKKTGNETQKMIRNINFYNTALQNFFPAHNQVFNNALVVELLNRELDYEKVYSHDLWITNVSVVTGKLIFDNCSHTLYRMHQNNGLGYGKEKIDWLKGRIERAKKKEGKKFSIQLEYFAELYKDKLTFEEMQEVKRFLEFRSNFPKRIKYALSSKFYRQSIGETMLMQVFYCLGGYQ